MGVAVPGNTLQFLFSVRFVCSVVKFFVRVFRVMTSIHPGWRGWNCGDERNQFDGACRQIDDGPADASSSGLRSGSRRNVFC